MGVEPELLAERSALEREGPAVVCIGGGHGLAQALKAVTRYAGRITAIVTVADDGGSSGRLAPALEIPPPGDIRKCLIALTPDSSVWRRLFEYRFEGADVEGHSLGNLIIASLADLEGDFEAALRACERLLGSVGSVIPCSPQRLHLAATINGVEVDGQAAITRTRGSISDLRLIPADPPANSSAVASIREADQIVLGPGSLYTSVLAPLMVPEIRDAVNESPARLVYVANLITQDGETLGMDAADHLDAILTLAGIRPPGVVIANTGPISVDPPLETVVVDPDVLATYGVDVEFADLLDPTVEWPRHDHARLGGSLGRLISNDPS
jgi:uncharacterized cofD-like protein